MSYIKAVVNKLVKKFSTRDPYELALNLNIKIIVDKMPLSIKGFYSNVMDMAFIYLNCELDENERKIVCCHELGHAMLHPCANSLFLSRNTFIVPSKLELQADKFVAELLVSDNDVKTLQEENISLEDMSAQMALPLYFLELKLEKNIS